MTLKETFLELAFAKISSEELRDKSVEVVDEFAIEFAIWLLKKSEKYDSYLKLIRDSKQLLEIYKKEKGL